MLYISQINSLREGKCDQHFNIKLLYNKIKRLKDYAPKWNSNEIYIAHVFFVKLHIRNMHNSLTLSTTLPQFIYPCL